MDAAAEAGTAFVFMGHGTSHTANVTYDQMQTQMENLGLKNAFIGTVEGKPEDTACDKVIEKVKEAGYKNVVLRPLMVVAGDHASILWEALRSPQILMQQQIQRLILLRSPQNNKYKNI